MRTQSFPALLSLRVWVAILLIGGAAASTRIAGQQSPVTNNSIAMNAPVIPLREAIAVPAGAPDIPSTLALTDDDRVQLAIGNYQRLLDENRISGNREGTAEELVAMASAYRAIHQEQKALDLFQSAIAIFHDLGNRDYEATALAHVGDVYREWGFSDTALRFYGQARGVYSETSDKQGQAAALNNSGVAWLSLSNRKKCLEFLEDAITSYQALQDGRQEALALSNLGAAHFYFSDRPEKALQAFQQAVSKMQILGDKSGQANALDMMGFVWLKAHRDDMAVSSFQKARDLYHDLGDARGEARVTGHMLQPPQADRSKPGRMAVMAGASPEPLILTAARLRVSEETR